MQTHDEMRTELMSDPAFKAEFDRLAPEYELLDQLLRARKEAGLTQAELAERMGTKPPAISRLMNGLGSDKYSPSVATLRKYAKACGMKLQIQLVK